MGQAQRQGREEAHIAYRHGWYGPEYAGLWLCTKSSCCAAGSRFGRFAERVSKSRYANEHASRPTLIYESNLGVLQTTVAEVVTVEEHQRESHDKMSLESELIVAQHERTPSCPLYGVLGMDDED